MRSRVDDTDEGGSRRRKTACDFSLYPSMPNGASPTVVGVVVALCLILRCTTYANRSLELQLQLRRLLPNLAWRCASVDLKIPERASETPESCQPYIAHGVNRDSTGYQQPLRTPNNGARYDDAHDEITTAIYAARKRHVNPVNRGWPHD